MSVKLFKASNFTYTPFGDFINGDLDFLSENGVEIGDSPSASNIIISQNIKHLRKHLWRGFFGKSFLIWTNEPRFDTHFVKSKRIFFNLFRCHFMNIYTEDVCVTNLSNISSYKFINKNLKLLPSDFQLKNKRTIALMSYFKGVDSPPLMRANVNIDLIATRAKIAVEGHKLKRIDVFGKGWPDGISKEDSRYGNWKDRKQELLKTYAFNLCFENTVAKNYITEKIWDSIESYCLPIYFGEGTNIYDLFPEDSFIDYSKLNSPEALFKFIDELSNIEYVQRLNKCISVYNSISLNGESIRKEERKKILIKIVEKVNFIQSS